ncbi:hypothetical protein [Chitinophaga sp. OAE865]|uniref:hypothetical protein n=1 Tax=Chitinophaga sp. OAE865 TaxID=2817898 RepID=UPI001AE2F357
MYNADLRMTGYISAGQDVTSLLSKFSIMVWLTFITTMVSAQTAKVNLRKEVNIPAADMQLDELLHLVSKQAGIRFSVNTRKFPGTTVVHIKKGRQPLSRLLGDLRESTGMGYRALESHIIFVDNPAPLAAKRTPAAVKPSKVIQPVHFFNRQLSMLPARQAASLPVTFLPMSVAMKQDTMYSGLFEATADSSNVKPAGFRIPLHATGNVKDTIVNIYRSPRRSFAATLVEHLRPAGGHTPVAGGTENEEPIFSFKPYAAAGMVADESFYVNPTIQAGLPFLYVIGSWSTNFSFSMLRYGAGTSMRLPGSWRLHVQVTTGRIEAAGYDSLGYIPITVKAQLHKLSLVTEKQIGNQWGLQVGAALNSLQTTYYRNNEPAPLNKEENEALANIKYFKPPYTISNNFSPDAGRSNKLWIGFQAGIFYRLNFYKE